MDNSTRLAVRNGMYYLKPILRNYILTAISRNDVFETTLNTNTIPETADIRILLKILSDNWQDVFGYIMPPVALSYVRELSNVPGARKVTKHEFSLEEARRALEIMELFAQTMGATLGIEMPPIPQDMNTKPIMTTTNHGPLHSQPDTRGGIPTVYPHVQQQQNRRSYHVATKDDLQDWVANALRANGGRATLIEVAKHIWNNHEEELRRSYDLFYTWQYDMRWAANSLRRQGIMRSVESSPNGLWVLMR